MILAVDTFMRLNGKSGFVTELAEHLDDEPEAKTRKRIAFSSRGYKDLYSADEEGEKKEFSDEHRANLSKSAKKRWGKK